MIERIKLSLNYLLPKKCLTYLLGWIAKQPGGWLTNITIKIFIWYYKINMEEAEPSNISYYKTFNDFFSRNLKNNARTFDKNFKILIQSSDGEISQLGDIKNNQIFQAKGYFYSLESLLAENYQMAEKFYNGKFITTYLKINNYHRVHMPCDATLREMTYVPGDLFSVNSFNVSNISNIFSKNERVICYFDTQFGLMAQILIGATIVGSISTVWSGIITPPRTGIIKRWVWPKKNEKNSVHLYKGEEMGHFSLGSTVINLFAFNNLKFIKNLCNGSTVFFGQKIGTLLYNL